MFAIAPHGSPKTKHSEDKPSLQMASRRGQICQVNDPNPALQLNEVTETTLIASQRAAYTNCHPLHFQAFGEHADDIMIARARS